MVRDTGVVRDKELKLEDGEASHALGGAGEGDQDGNLRQISAG